MPLVTLSLVATGDTITAARTNSERTNFNLLDARTGGDPGAARKQLVSTNATDATWQDPVQPAVRCYHGPQQTAANAVPTALVYAFERFDTDTMHDAVVNPSRITCRTAGIYMIGGEIEFDSNANGDRFVYIRHSSGLFIASNWDHALSGSAHRISVATMYRLEVNEYVELVGAQSSGITLNMNTQSNDANEFWAGRIGA
jgi:hypothetical protein